MTKTTSQADHSKSANLARKNAFTGLTPGRIIAMAGLIVVLTGMFFWFLSYRQHQERLEEATFLCAEDNEASLVGEAAAVYDLADLEKMAQLGEVVERIQSIEGHEKHYNCVYPVLGYYTYVGDIENANTYYDYLVAAQDDGQTLAGIYDYKFTLDSFRVQIDHIKIREEATDENTLFIRVD